MGFRRVTAICFAEDDTFVVVFAFVHLGGGPGSASCPVGGVRGAPPLFLFARGLRGGRLGTRASGPPVFYSIVKLRAAGAAYVAWNLM
jgi:hypothetical protein